VRKLVDADLAPTSVRKAVFALRQALEAAMPTVACSPTPR
jgi:hypothetical protein